MKKFLTFGIITIVISGVFIPGTEVFAGLVCSDGSAPFIAPDTGDQQCTDGNPPVNNPNAPSATTQQPSALGAVAQAGDLIMGATIKPIGHLLMLVSSFILLISGSIFDYVLSFTVTDMARNIGTGSAIGTSISEAWSTLRDIANLVFIFALLYTAFRTMFLSEYSSVGKTILNIIIIALLINFSLFFTKVVIDASNIVSDGFYRAIASSNNVSINANGEADGTLGTLNLKSISGGYMRMLGLQTFYGTGILDGEWLASRILLTGITSAIFMLVFAIILLVTSVMFIARFVILIILMILSPVAFIAFIVPGLNGRFKDWWQALVNQSFFAPVFFALTWVTLKVGSSVVTSLNSQQGQWTSLITNPTGAMSLVLSYALIMGLAVASLVISKNIAAKGASAAAFNAVTGGVGTAGFGATSWVGRKTFGFAGNKIANNNRLQTEAGKERKTFFGSIGGGAARALKYTAEKAASSTFDARNAKLSTSVIGDAIQGTLGRTGFGKTLGLNDLNIPDIDVAQKIIKRSGADVGEAQKKGYKELKAESDKRVRERDAAAAAEFSLAQYKKSITDGSKAPAGSPLIGEMEKSLAKLSEKETEALVASNRELLRSQNFANAISVKQLEALNKSDQLSDTEKGDLKSMRFKVINDAMAAGGPVAGAVANKIKALSDSELEMIDSAHLEKEDFVGQLKGSQVDGINKSSKFTSNQKDKLKAARMYPIVNAMRTGNIGTIKSEFKKADIKTKIAYLKMDGPGGVKIGLHKDVLDTYNSKTLSRMAAHDDMTDSDISNLRRQLLTGGPGGTPLANAATVAWLKDPNKGEVDFPA